MWLFTTLGFFSVVQKPGDTGLTIRARVAADLDRLRAAHLPALSPTVHGAGTDYPYRATIGHEAFGRALIGLVDELHYGNFKDAVAATMGHDRAHVYGEVWQTLLALEQPASQPGTPAPGTPFHVVADGDGLVAAWSVARLPFDPSGWRREFRDALRAPVRALAAGPGEVLYAAYTSADRAPVDAENVLLYNLEAGQLAASTGDGLRFERSYRSPQASPVELNGAAGHRHEYRVVPRAAPFRHWAPTGTLMRWEAALPTIGALRSCAQVWRALKASAPEAPPESTSAAHFGVRIAVSLPVGATVTAATLVKPLVDGVVAAAHRHDGTDEDEIAARLAAQLGVDTSQISALLRSGAGDVLGARRVVHRFGATVQWSPRDEDCVACELLLTRDVPGSGCRVVAEIVDVAPIAGVC